MLGLFLKDPGRSQHKKGSSTSPVLETAQKGVPVVDEEKQISKRSYSISVQQPPHRERYDHEPKMRRDNIGTAAKERERKREQEYFFLCGKASSRKIGARASRTEKVLWAEAGSNFSSPG